MHSTAPQSLMSWAADYIMRDRFHLVIPRNAWAAIAVCIFTLLVHYTIALRCIVTQAAFVRDLFGLFLGPIGVPFLSLFDDRLSTRRPLCRLHCGAWCVACCFFLAFPVVQSRPAIVHLGDVCTNVIVWTPLLFLPAYGFYFLLDRCGNAFWSQRRSWSRNNAISEIRYSIAALFWIAPFVAATILFLRAYLLPLLSPWPSLRMPQMVF